MNGSSRENGQRMMRLLEVCKLVIDWFNNSYCPTSLRLPATSAFLSLPAQLIGQLHSFISEVFNNMLTPTTIFLDNKLAIKLSKDRQYHAHKTYWYLVLLHFLGYWEGSLCLIYCPIQEMLANTLTKPLANVKAKISLQNWGLHVAWGGVLELQACVNIPITILPFVHAPLLIIVYHSHAFLLIHFSIYLSCYILHIYSHSYGLMLLHTHLYIYTDICITSGIAIFLCDMRWAPTLICYIILLLISYLVFC